MYLSVCLYSTQYWDISNLMEYNREHNSNTKFRDHFWSPILGKKTVLQTSDFQSNCYSEQAFPFQRDA